MWILRASPEFPSPHSNSLFSGSGDLGRLLEYPIGAVSGNSPISTDKYQNYI